MATRGRPRKNPVTPEPGAEGSTYENGGYPASEHLEPMEGSHGFTVDDVVEFVTDWADDVPAGRHGVIEAIDNHPTMPLRVKIHLPGGGFIFGCPVKPDEVVKVGNLAEPPAEPEDAPEASSDDDEPQAVSA